MPYDQKKVDRELNRLEKRADDAEKRLAESTALLKQVSIGYAETGSNPRMQAIVKAFLSATPSHPAEPAPSLVEQIEPAIRAILNEGHPYSKGAAEAVGILRAIQRAAREAGGKSPPAEPAPSLVEQTARLEVISSHRDTLQEAWETAASQAVTPAERAVLDATGFFDELNLCALERSGQEVFAAAVRSLRAAREAGGR
jgi:hypothetical protein